MWWVGVATVFNPSNVAGAKKQPNGSLPVLAAGAYSRLVEVHQSF